MKQVSRCPPLLHGLTLSSLAMSVPTIVMISRCQVSGFQSPPQLLCTPTLQLLQHACITLQACSLPGWRETVTEEILSHRLRRLCYKGGDTVIEWETSTWPRGDFVIPVQSLRPETRLWGKLCNVTPALECWSPPNTSLRPL